MLERLVEGTKNLSAEEIRGIATAAERVAERFATAGDIDRAAGAWAIFRAYQAILAARAVSL